MKLSEILSPELYAQVKARIDEVNKDQPDKTKHVRFADLSEGGYVSTEKFKAQTEARDNQIGALQEQIKQRDSDITDLNAKLTAAQGDATKLGDVQKQLGTLQTKYQQDQQKWAAEAAKQRKEFMVRERANDLKFTSAAAKREFIRQANEKDFQLDGDVLMGYEDFTAKYKADNADSFVVDKPADPKPSPAPADPPTIVLPGKPTPPSGGKSLSELMAAKNANPDMVVSFGK